MIHLTREERFLAMVVALSLILRLGTLWWATGHADLSAFLQGDTKDYIALAEHLRMGDGFTKSGIGAETFRTPGLPLLLVPFTLLPSGTEWYWFALVSSLAGGIGLPYMTYVLGKRLFGMGSARIAAVLVAVEPMLIMLGWRPMSEVAFMLFSLGGFLLALYAYDRSSALLALGAGALLGYAALIRPALLPTMAVVVVASIGYLAVRRMRWSTARIPIIVAAGLLLVLLPWYVRTHNISGSWALSATGWRNVYTDYYASLRALEHKTEYPDEQHLLIVELPTHGIPIASMDDPAYEPRYRDTMVPILWEHRETVAKLETVSLLSFFSNDGYYYELRRYGFLPPPETGSPGQPPVVGVLYGGSSGMQAAWEEIARQRYVPLFGRLFTFGSVLLAGVGLLTMLRKPQAWMVAGIIILSALSASVLGLEVKARLRAPIEPFIFMLAGVAIEMIMLRLVRWRSSLRRAITTGTS